VLSRLSASPLTPSRTATYGLALCALLGGVSMAPAGRESAVVPATRATTGRIEGEVLISTALSTRRPRFRIYAEPGQGARPPAPQTQEITNVVLYLQQAPGLPAGVPGTARVEQEDERFVPHVVPVVRGSTVEFPNGDEVFHNVFSLSSAKSFDLGRYRKGSSKAVVFERSGVIQVFCHIHSDMSAVVLVLDNPYFAIPSAVGRYTIDDVPPGEYTVVGWHERIHPVQRTVRVVAGQTARLDFNIPLPAGGEPPGR
jgi:plastocyanin